MSQTSMFKVALSLLTLALLVPTAWPQASTATVSGTVRDQSGAVVPNASVTLTNSATSIVSKTTTNPVGIYFFLGIVPGPYDILVEAQGMQKFEGKLTVQVQQSAVVDAVLKVGQTATEISVQDVTPMLTVDNPTLSHVLERQRIEQDAFAADFRAASPDFQSKHGYSASKYKEDVLKLASKYVGHAFGCLSLTLEMPFKDNADAPDGRVGWSGARSHRLGAAMLDPLFRHLQRA